MQQLHRPILFVSKRRHFASIAAAHDICVSTFAVPFDGQNKDLLQAQRVANPDVQTEIKNAICNV